MRWLQAFILGVLISSVAQAEGTPEDEARLNALASGLSTLRACVEGSATVDCVGGYATACIGTAEQSHVGQGNCVHEELSMWELVHAETLIEKLNQARALDESEVLIGMRSGGGRIKLLMQSEASWVAHATNQCSLEMRRWGAGTIVTTERPYCDISMIAARIDVLRDLQL